MSINPNAALVAKQLKEAGLTKAQIAGVLGNFQLESGFNPRINEGGKVGAPMGRGGYGFAQWTGGRQTNLVNFAKSRKMDPGDPNLQTQFLIHELRGPEKRAFESLKGAVSPEESARRFLTDFERAGIPKTKQRQEAARQIYGKLGFLDAPAPGAASPTPQPATASTPQEKGNQLGTSLLQRVMGILPSIMPQRQSSLLPTPTPELSGQSFLDTYRMFFDDELV
jgi:hypothetical protein